jgi:hypothetical protein
MRVLVDLNKCQSYGQCRLVEPRLLEDPPPYRDNAALRGPRHVMVGFERRAKMTGLSPEP